MPKKGMRAYELSSPNRYGHLVNNKKLNQHKPWTPEEDAVIRAYYGKETASALETRFEKRTRNAIISRANTLGLGSPKNNPTIAASEHHQENKLQRARTRERLSAAGVAQRVAGRGRIAMDNEFPVDRWENPQECVPELAEYSRKKHRDKIVPKATQTNKMGVPVTATPEQAEAKRLAGIERLGDRVFKPMPGMRLVSLFDLKSTHCRWPLDKDGQTFFCGAVKLEGPYSYCAMHHTCAQRGANSINYWPQTGNFSRETR